MRAIAVKLGWTQEGALVARYELEGDLRRLRIPETGSAPRDGLWRHTCFELFIGGARPGRECAYLELNFSPSGQSTACDFRSYRQRSVMAEPPPDSPVDCPIEVRRREGRLALDAVIRLDRLGISRGGESLSLGAAAVIEGREGLLTYWALRHAPGKPDFHHPDSFVLELK